jgi:hypothetical protein
MRAALVLPALAVCAACGYVGDPLPPALHIPEPVKDLRVVQRGSDLVIEFTTPQFTMENLPLKIAAIDLRAGAHIEAQWEATAVPIGVPSDASGAVQAVVPASEWTGKTMEFRVRTQSDRGRLSEWSNAVIFEVQAPLQSPIVTSESVSEGACLRWREDPSATGYRVFRRTASGEEFVPVADTETAEYLDADIVFGRSYDYAVRTIRRQGEQESQSAMSPTVRVDRKDVFGPSAPAGVVAVAGAGSVELAWNSSPEPDLKSFRIYRSEGDRAPVIAGEVVGSTSYTDRGVHAGKTYSYAISAVDQLGNEGPRSAPFSISVQ